MRTDPINQEVAVEPLTSVRLEMTVANNGDEAVASSEQETFDLILMDMQMPEMNGIEETRLIRKLPTGRDVPILAITANAFVEDREHCLAAGMNDFVSKPVDPNALYAALLTWSARVRPDRSALKNGSPIGHLK